MSEENWIPDSGLANHALSLCPREEEERGSSLLALAPRGLTFKCHHVGGGVSTDGFWGDRDFQSIAKGKLYGC